jgi:predicted ferric reductase
MTNELWWYVARSCGLISWFLLCGCVLWGLVLSSKGFRQRFTAAWVLDLHRYLGGLAVVFMVLHIVGLVQDKYMHFGLAQLFVPLTSQWRPGAVAWGVASLYMLLAVEISSLIRRRLPVKVWRMTHMLAFPLFLSATAHLLTAGTDARTDALRWGAIAMVAVMMLATVLRVGSLRAAHKRATAAANALEAAHATPAASDRFDRRRAMIAEARARRVAERESDDVSVS